jgi:hypothetical protein
MDYDPPVLVVFTKKSKATLQDFNYYRFDSDITEIVHFKAGDKIEEVKHISTDLKNPKLSVISVEADKMDDEIAFKTYFDIPSDSFKVIQ